MLANLRLRSATAALVAGTVLAFATIAQAGSFTFKHDQGETVIETVPETVIVTDWAAFDNLDALGVKVAGVPSSVAPPYLADKVPADALRVGSLQEPDIEGIAAAEPDLVIVAARSRTSYPTIASIAPTIDASIDNNDIVAGVIQRLNEYGRIFGVEDRAAELVADLEARVAEARAAAEGKGTALVIVTNAGRLGVYGPGSRVSWVYRTLGLPSVFDHVDDSDHGGDAISFEYLVETDPDWLFVVDRDAGVGNEGAARTLLDNDLLRQTSFWKNQQVVYLDPGAAYVTMNGYQGLVLMLDQVIAALK